MSMGIILVIHGHNPQGSRLKLCYLKGKGKVNRCLFLFFDRKEMDFYSSGFYKNIGIHNLELLTV